jgi:ATP-binding cassette subfamily G (WHITE) protein 2 (SNQ2)
MSSAEYMLEVIGAGATAVAERDWHEAWLNSREREQLGEDINRIHTEGRKHPPAERSLRGSYATAWIFQTQVLTRRQYASYWRNPSYILSKLMLNIIGGLFIGFTFFKAGNSIQDSQDKLFVSEVVLCVVDCFTDYWLGDFHGHRTGMFT